MHFFSANALSVLAVLSLIGCKEPGPTLDLVDLSLTETIDEILSTDHDRFVLGAGTVILPGTLNVDVSPVTRFEIAGVKLPPSEDYDGPNVKFMLYSDQIMADLAERVESGVGGGQVRVIKLGADETLAGQLATLGAAEQIIGVAVSYIGNEPLFEELQASLTARLGPSTPMPNYDEGKFWQEAGRFIAIAPEFGSFVMLAENQVVDGCLFLGPVGVLDVSGCDLESFNTNFPMNLRTKP